MSDAVTSAASFVGAVPLKAVKALSDLTNPEPPQSEKPPAVVNPDDLATGKKIKDAENDMSGRMGRGMASNMLAAFGGRSSGYSTSRSVLLGD